MIQYEQNMKNVNVYAEQEAITKYLEKEPDTRKFIEQYNIYVECYVVIYKHKLILLI